MVIEQWTCDLCDAPAVRTVVIETSEVDLCGDHLDAYDRAIRPFADASRPIRRPAARSTPRPGGATSGAARPGGDGSTIRAWGREHGWTVRDRGPLPADLRKAYAAAHK